MDETQADVPADLRVSTIWDESLALSVRQKAGSPVRGRKINKESMIEDAQYAYLAVGGPERLAHEANQDFKWFAKQFIKPGVLLPDEHQTVDLNYQILPAIARSPLDGEYTDVTATAISPADRERERDAPPDQDPPVP